MHAFMEVILHTRNLHSKVSRQRDTGRKRTSTMVIKTSNLMTFRFKLQIMIFKIYFQMWTRLINANIIKPLNLHKYKYFFKETKCTKKMENCFW